MSKNYELFKKAVYEYIEYFGLFEYTVNIEIYKKTGYKGSCSVYTMEEFPEESPKSCSIFASEQWLNDKKTTIKDIHKTAFHEVIELMLSTLRDYALNTKFVVPNRDIDGECHKIIHIFENTIFNLIK